MPVWSLGFFSAVLLGSILSTFNSTLNSAATLFGVELYKIYLNPAASDEHVVKMSTRFGAILTILSCIIAPFLVYIDSIFEYVQRARTFAGVPVLTVFIVSTFTPAVDAFAVKVAFLVGAVIHFAGQFLPGVHYLNVYFVCFLVSLFAALVTTHVPMIRTLCHQPPLPAAPQRTIDRSAVDIATWRWLYAVIGVIGALIVFLTLSLQFANRLLFAAFGAVWSLSFVAIAATPCSIRKTSAQALPEANAAESQELVETQVGAKGEGPAAAESTSAYVAQQRDSSVG